MEPIKPLTLKLEDQIVIEASAGTGKTYATATIYVRLVLGINTPDNKAYQPSEILVVTFTEDAADELRSRIFQRLSDSIMMIQQKNPENELEMELLSEIAQLEFPEHQFESAEAFAIARLQSALISMDESAIFTIHGFAHRVLSEFAFETSAPFDFDLITNTTELKNNAAADFWRKHVLTLPAQTQERVTRALKSPSSLARSFIRHTQHTDVIYGEGLSIEQVERLQSQNIVAIGELVRAFEEAGGPQAMAEALLSMGLKGNVYSKKTLSGKLTNLYENALDGQVDNSKDLALLSVEKFNDSKNKTSTANYENIPGSQHLVQFFENYRSINWDMVESSLRERANAFMNAYIGDDKSKNSLLDFDDLLSLLEQALHSASGDRLAEALATKYPIACVDEFQDTDPAQYAIFNKIYSSNAAQSLLMIGDPKQAIYAFRGGDIHTYLTARAKAPKQFTLDTNYRSHPDAVSAVNKIFAGVDLAKNASKHEMLYQSVKANSLGKAEYSIKGERQPGVDFVSFDKQLSSSTAAEHFLAEQCAAHVSRLLAKGVDNTALVGGESLAPQHIAILVTTHAQGEKVVAALNKFGIDSVSRTRQSVFSTQTAKDLLVLVQSIMNPGNDRAVKSAICSQTLAYSQSELDELFVDDDLWDHQLNILAEAKTALMEQGIAVAVQHVWNHLSIGDRIAQTKMAERIITNWRHIVELLQIKEQEVPGAPELLQYFAQQVARPDGSEDQEMRLESEDNLVQIVTLHKSKGLEYPLVFMPFTTLPSRARSNVYYDEGEEGSRKVIDLSAANPGEQAQAEHAAEQLRLFYVGITRAKFSTIVYVTNVERGRRQDLPGVESSQLAQVLECASIEDILVRLSDLAQNNEIRFVQNPKIEGVSYSPAIDSRQAPVFQRFIGKIDRSWRIASYSSINKDSDEHYITEESIESKTGEDATGLMELEEIGKPTGIEQSFPAGAVAGQCLHDILEGAVNNGTTNISQTIGLNLQRYGFDPELEGETCDWMGRVLTQPICNGTKSIAELTPQTALAEMQFHLATGMVTAENLNKILRQHPLHKKDLAFYEFQGLLTGFIDLTIVDDKAWIIDYKSNRLCEYTDSSLSESITDHRYYVQYLIYTVALHRHLSRRWPQYSYESHFGGVEYLYLRGMTGARRAGVWFEKPDFALIDQLDKLLSTKKGVTA